MAFTITDQGTNTNTTGATVAMSPSANIATGSTIVVVTYEKNTAGTTGTLADSASNTYTKAANISPNNTSSNGRVTIWYCINCSALTTAQSITYTKQNNAVNGYIGTVSAVTAGTVTLDQNATPTTGSSASPLISATGTSGTEWYVAGVGIAPNAVGDTFTQASGWSNGPDHVAITGGAGSGGGGNRTGTGAQTWGPTITSRAWGCVLLVFQENFTTRSFGIIF